MSHARDIIESNRLETLTLIRAHLTVAGIKVKAQEKEIKKAKADGILDNVVRATGFSSHYYDFLAEGPRSKEEAKAYLYDGTSENTQKHESHYLNIWELVADVRAECDSKLEAALKELEELKAA